MKAPTAIFSEWHWYCFIAACMGVIKVNESSDFLMTAFNALERLVCVVRWLVLLLSSPLSVSVLLLLYYGWLSVTLPYGPIYTLTYLHTNASTPVTEWVFVWSELNGGVETLCVCLHCALIKLWLPGKTERIEDTRTRAHQSYCGSNVSF